MLLSPPLVDGGELIARYRQNNQLVSESPEEEPHLYVWDLNQTMYIIDSTWDEKTEGRLKHTSVLDAAPALSAGKLYIGKSGGIWGINFSR